MSALAIVIVEYVSQSKMKYFLPALCSFLILQVALSGQSDEQNNFQNELPKIHIKKNTAAEFKIDGVLDEMEWQNAGRADNFWQYFPTDSAHSIGPTEILMTYDETYLYVGVKCHTIGKSYVIPSLRRDYRFPGNDNITLLFDTYNDKNNAFVFGMNPYGVRREALIANGGRQGGDFNGSWDNKWLGAANIEDAYWSAEFAIPFKTIRFNEGSEKWRFNCYRNDTQHNEMSSWIRIPQNYIIMDLSFMGDIVWDEPLGKAGTNVAVIPYATTNITRDFEDVNETGLQWSGDIGGDAKIGITSGLNLDLTVNPDFSQVEVDQQITDLSRFELFFPERRQFFIENEDLFGSFGLTRVNPFFSRRIGIEIDPETGVNVQNPILYGARLSGKLNENFRLGVLNMQTAKLSDSGLPGFNYSVGAFQQKVFDRSNISLIVANKQAVNGREATSDFQDYTRVAGLEYRLASADNRWTGKFFYHHVFTPEDLDHNFTQGAQLEYLRRDYRLELASLVVGNGYDIDEIGFAPRKDYWLLSPEAQLFFYPKNGTINQHSINIDSRFFIELGKAQRDFDIGNFELSERQIEVNWEFRFANNTQGEFMVTENELTLLDDFDPTNLQDDGVELRGGDKFHFVEFSASYNSDQRKKFLFELQPTIGQFYNGFRAGIGGELNYRIQPYGTIGMAFDYNYVQLDKPFRPVNIWVVGPKFDLTFSKQLFLTTFVQYNNQFDNLNINARLQWRYKPVSDFFIVYTDNYLTESFSQFTGRNRALVAKVTYWLNL